MAHAAPWFEPPRPRSLDILRAPSRPALPFACLPKDGPDDRYPVAPYSFFCGSTGPSLRLRVTGGQRHDSTQARAWMEAGTDASLPCLIADRAYDRDSFRAWLAQRDIEAVLPARRGRTHPQPHDPEKYKARNAVERGIGGLKPWCRVATHLRQIRATVLEFSVLGGGLALAESLNQHALVH